MSEENKLNQGKMAAKRLEDEIIAPDVEAEDVPKSQREDKEEEKSAPRKSPRKEKRAQGEEERAKQEEGRIADLSMPRFKVVPDQFGDPYHLQLIESENEAEEVSKTNEEVVQLHQDPLSHLASVPEVAIGDIMEKGKWKSERVARSYTNPDQTLKRVHEGRNDWDYRTQGHRSTNGIEVVPDQFGDHYQFAIADEERLEHEASEQV